MKFYDIDKLKRDTKQDNLYNFFATTFVDFNDLNFPLSNTSATEEQYMRLDLISQEIYKSDSYVDILCNVNYIDNPLNIMESDVLVYPSISQMENYKTDDINIEATPGILQNAEKTTLVDENRKKYVEQKYTLTPTTVEVPKEPLKIIKNNIVIGE